MKKVFVIGLVVLLVFSFMSCTKKTKVVNTTTLSICHLVNGNLGDQSFFDSAEAGLRKLATEGKINYKTIQMGGTDADQPKWLSILTEVSSSSEYDLIVCGSPQYADYIKKVAELHPEKKYLVYDTSISLPNVISITYAQNDMGFLIGIIAASYTNINSIKGVNPQKVIGFVGGMDIPTINDFLWGYIDGAKYVDPSIKIDAQYIGNFWDAAAAKEIANVMIDSYKCDILWGVASAAGIGVAESAKEHGVWFLGVDSDQEKIFADKQPELAKITVTSGLKNVGDSLVFVIEKLLKGEKPWGKTFKLGIAENGVGFASEGNYKSLPENIRNKVEQAKKEIISGKITVDTAFGNDISSVRRSYSPRSIQ